MPVDSPTFPARQIEALNEVARIATLDLELRPMLQRITDALSRRFDWDFVALMIVALERHAFEVGAVTSSLPTAIESGYLRELGSGVVGEVAVTQRPILLDDVSTSTNYVETTPGIRSELCVPVHHAGRLVAILNLESTRLSAFHDQLPLVTTVADQIAGAIASARLFEELRRRAELMQMMSNVSRTALDATDLDDLLTRFVHYIYDRFPLDIVAVLLCDPSREEFVQRAHASQFEGWIGSRWPVSRGVVGRTIRTGTTQLVPDVATDPDYVSMNPDLLTYPPLKVSAFPGSDPATA